MLILRKMVLALTGLFICLFLSVHLGGNLILLLPETTARPLYNTYSASLGSNPLIAIIAYLNYACFIFHALYGVLITARNRQARTTAYSSNRFQENSSWTSQNMGLLGAMLFAFIVIHLANFWYKAKILDNESDLYQMVIDLFKQPAYTALYVLAMLPLGLHLSHGISSAFRSLGLYHRKYLIWVDRIGRGYAIAIGFGFALIPVVLYVR